MEVATLKRTFTPLNDGVKFQSVYPNIENNYHNFVTFPVINAALSAAIFLSLFSDSQKQPVTVRIAVNAIFTVSL